MTPQCFILAGNGPYLNRGCEAIVRGTMVALRSAFGPDIKAIAASFGSPDTILQQAGEESDPGIGHIPLRAKARSWEWFQDRINARLGTNLPGGRAPMVRLLRKTSAVLEIGGDNYSLDYGLPLEFLALDDLVLARRKPLVLWGASVGPFEKNVVFAERMFSHLRRFAALFVRETESYEYLLENGVSGNLHMSADPAFLMEPSVPKSPPHQVVEGAPVIGFNASPLMARFVTNSDARAWFDRCVNIVVDLHRELQMPVLLIPHVFQSGNNDQEFLQAVSDGVHDAIGVRPGCIQTQLSAAELKWVISRCGLFIGARTHSTIAAFSSLVPTISLAYSMKARGLNRDLLGCLDYCLEGDSIGPERVVEAAKDLLTDSAGVQSRMAESVQAVKRRAAEAGCTLRSIVSSKA